MAVGEGKGDVAREADRDKSPSAPNAAKTPEKGKTDIPGLSDQGGSGLNASALASPRSDASTLHLTPSKGDPTMSSPAQGGVIDQGNSPLSAPPCDRSSSANAAVKPESDEKGMEGSQAEGGSGKQEGSKPVNESVENVETARSEGDQGQPGPDGEEVGEEVDDGVRREFARAASREGFRSTTPSRSSRLVDIDDAGTDALEMVSPSRLEDMNSLGVDQFGGTEGRAGEDGKKDEQARAREGEDRKKGGQTEEAKSDKENQMDAELKEIDSRMDSLSEFQSEMAASKHTEQQQPRTKRKAGADNKKNTGKSSSVVSSKSKESSIIRDTKPLVQVHREKQQQSQSGRDRKRRDDTLTASDLVNSRANSHHKSSTKKKRHHHSKDPSGEDDRIAVPTVVVQQKSANSRKGELEQQGPAGSGVHPILDTGLQDPRLRSMGPLAVERRILGKAEELVSVMKMPESDRKKIIPPNQHVPFFRMVASVLEGCIRLGAALVDHDSKTNSSSESTTVAFRMLKTTDDLTKLIKTHQLATISTYRASVLNELASYHFKRGQANAALQCLQRVLTLNSRQLSTELAVCTLLRLSSLLSSCNKHHDALGRLHQALFRLNEAVNNPTDEDVSPDVVHRLTAISFYNCAVELVYVLRFQEALKAADSAQVASDSFLAAHVNEDGEAAETPKKWYDELVQKINATKKKAAAKLEKRRAAEEQRRQEREELERMSEVASSKGGSDASTVKPKKMKPTKLPRVALISIRQSIENQEGNSHPDGSQSARVLTPGGGQYNAYPPSSRPLTTGSQTDRSHRVKPAHKTSRALRPYVPRPEYANDGRDMKPMRSSRGRYPKRRSEEQEASRAKSCEDRSKTNEMLLGDDDDDGTRHRPFTTTPAGVPRDEEGVASDRAASVSGQQKMDPLDVVHGDVDGEGEFMEEEVADDIPNPEHDHIATDLRPNTASASGGRRPDSVTFSGSLKGGRNKSNQHNHLPVKSSYNSLPYALPDIGPGPGKYVLPTQFGRRPEWEVTSSWETSTTRDGSNPKKGWTDNDSHVRSKKYTKPGPGSYPLPSSVDSSSLLGPSRTFDIGRGGPRFHSPEKSSSPRRKRPQKHKDGIAINIPFYKTRKASHEGHPNPGSYDEGIENHEANHEDGEQYWQDEEALVYPLESPQGGKSPRKKKTHHLRAIFGERKFEFDLRPMRKSGGTAAPHAF